MRQIIAFTSNRGWKIVQPLYAAGIIPIADIRCTGGLKGYLKAFCRLIVTLLKTGRNACVLTDTPHYIGSMAYLGSVLFGRKMIFRSRGDALAEYSDRKVIIQTIIYKYFMILKCETIIAVSQYLKNMLIAQGASQSKIRVVFPPQAMPPSLPLPMENRSRRILIVTSFKLRGKCIALSSILPALDQFLSSHSAFTIAVGNFATFFSMLVMMFLFVKDKGDITTASFIWSLSYFLGGLVLFVILHKVTQVSYRPIFHLPSWSLHLKESLHFTVAGSLLSLYQYLPIIYLGIFAAAYEVGIFSAPYRLIVAITYVISIIPLSLYPIFSELFAKDKKRFKKLHRNYKVVSLLIGSIVLVMGNIYAEFTINIFFGSKYAQCIPYYRIILIYVFFFCIRNPYGIVLSAAGFQRYNTIASGIGVAYFTAAFFLLKLIVDLGYPMIASISLASTEFIISVTMMIIWKKMNVDDKTINSMVS